MSPAPVVAETLQDLQLQTLARAFEALLLTTQQLGRKERRLQQRLEYANSEYLKLADRLPEGPDTHTKIVSEKILGRYTEYEPSNNPSLNPPDVVKALADSGNVGEQMLTAITEGLECYKSILHGQDDQDDHRLSDANPCLVATRAGVPPPIEMDFTTKGTQGQLRCPFAKPQNKPSENGASHVAGSHSNAPNGVTCGHADLDPIKAEKSERNSSRAPSASARSSTTRCPIARCPIRYLDKHSPEDVAEYVEKHKHEIPRSHAICVQRYQKDSSSMRQLDAKYGSLINMIRGLSVKHQAFLPDHQNNSDAPVSSSSAERVEKWAEEVGLKSDTQPPIKEEEGPEEEDRKGHFDRPLREVRVGESPSRPWGIPVPMSPIPSAPQSPTAAAPALASTGDQVNGIPGHDALGRPSMKPGDAPKKGRCPFGHGAPASDPPAPDPPAPETETIRHPQRTDEDMTREETKSPEESFPPPHSPANIVFNGPVFFGFSPEQTAAFLQQLGQMGHNKMGL